MNEAINETDKVDKLLVADIKPSNQAVRKFGTAITLILVITLAAICGVVVILLAIALAFNTISFDEAKDVLSLILVALSSLTGAALGFYFAVIAAQEPKNQSNMENFE